MKERICTLIEQMAKAENLEFKLIASEAGIGFQIAWYPADKKQKPCFFFTDEIGALPFYSFGEIGNIKSLKNTDMLRKVNKKTVESNIQKSINLLIQNAVQKGIVDALEKNFQRAKDCSDIKEGKECDICTPILKTEEWARYWLFEIFFPVYGKEI